MNVMKHTPGPWAVDLTDGRFIVRDANDDVVADCWNGTIGDEGETALETCEPNARLIAAAPDMLDAGLPLVAEIAAYPASAGEDDDELVSVRLGDLRALAAAIAKATGSAS